MLAKLIISLFVCVSACTAHMCMIMPPQRSNMTGLNTVGSPDCALTTAPCGGIPASFDKVYFKGVSNISVVFQKNQNFYNAANPGYFSVSLGTASGSMFKELARMVDTQTPSRTIFRLALSIPVVPMTQAMIIQMKYVPNNPVAAKEYYQCSDILILA